MCRCSFSEIKAFAHNAIAQSYELKKLHYFCAFLVSFKNSFELFEVVFETIRDNS